MVSNRLRQNTQSSDNGCPAGGTTLRVASGDLYGLQAQGPAVGERTDVPAIVLEMRGSLVRGDRIRVDIELVKNEQARLGRIGPQIIA
jgi:hypothetical protein